ncbi:hypothetical protein KC326_g114 [Hortaea werneckii]|nr:hypothetical protein KC326_g114 [Hortaea werneckii]
MLRIRRYRGLPTTCPFSEAMDDNPIHPQLARMEILRTWKRQWKWHLVSIQDIGRDNRERQRSSRPQLVSRWVCLFGLPGLECVEHEGVHLWWNVSL